MLLKPTLNHRWANGCYAWYRTHKQLLDVCLSVSFWRWAVKHAAACVFFVCFWADVPAPSGSRVRRIQEVSKWCNCYFPLFNERFYRNSHYKPHPEKVLFAISNCAIISLIFLCAGGDVPAGLHPAVHHSSLQTVQGWHRRICHLLSRRP